MKIRVRSLNLETEAEKLDEFKDSWDFLIHSGYDELQVVRMIKCMNNGTDKNFVRIANVHDNIIHLYIDRPLVRTMHEALPTDGLYFERGLWHIVPSVQSARRIWKFLRLKKFTVRPELALLLKKLATQKELHFETITVTKGE